jgi:hypothetical protein
VEISGGEREARQSNAKRSVERKREKVNIASKKEKSQSALTFPRRLV